MKIQTLKSQNTMAQAMKGVSRAMMNMNRQMNMPQIQQILHEFEKQSEIMDMKVNYFFRIAKNLLFHCKGLYYSRRK